MCGAQLQSFLRIGSARSNGSHRRKLNIVAPFELVLNRNIGSRINFRQTFSFNPTQNRHIFNVQPLFFSACTHHRYLIYTRKRICIYQKVKPKISAVSPHHNRRRPYWSFPLIKKCYRKHYTFLHLCIKYFLAAQKRIYCQLCLFPQYKYTNYHAPCQLCGNDQRLRSGFNFRLPTVWDAPSSVYEIFMVLTQRHKPVFHFNRIVAKRSVFYCVYIVNSA